MIAGHKKTGSIGRFFITKVGSNSRWCYVVPEGDSRVPYITWLADELYREGYTRGYMLVDAGYFSRQ